MTADIGEIARQLRAKHIIITQAELHALMRQAADALERLVGERDADIERLNRALAKADIEAERAGNLENDKEAAEARAEAAEARLKESVDLLDGLLGLEKGSGQRALDFVEQHRASAKQPRDSQ